MSKGSWGKVVGGGFLALVLANQASPGTAKRVVDNGADTATPVVDRGTEMLNEHLLPAASETVTAAKDGLANTNLLGPSEAPVWATPETVPQAGG